MVSNCRLINYGHSLHTTEDFENLIDILIEV